MCSQTSLQLLVILLIMALVIGRGKRKTYLGKLRSRGREVAAVRRAWQRAESLKRELAMRQAKRKTRQCIAVMVQATPLVHRCSTEQ